MDAFLELAKMYGPAGIIMGLYLYRVKDDSDNRKSDIESRIMLATSLDRLTEKIDMWMEHGK